MPSRSPPTGTPNRAIFTIRLPHKLTATEASPFPSFSFLPPLFRVFLRERPPETSAAAALGTTPLPRAAAFHRTLPPLKQLASSNQMLFYRIFRRPPIPIRQNDSVAPAKSRLPAIFSPSAQGTSVVGKAPPRLTPSGMPQPRRPAAQGGRCLKTRPFPSRLDTSRLACYNVHCAMHIIECSC